MLKGLQGKRAYQLARAYGHLWASSAREIVSRKHPATETEYELQNIVLDEIFENGVSIEEIESVSRSFQRPDLPAGIEGPWFDEDGNICHTTGTGRLAWTVYPDGAAMIEMFRPNIEGAVLVAWVYTEGGWDVSYARENILYERHIDALAEALNAINEDITLAVVRQLFPNVYAYCVDGKDKYASVDAAVTAAWQRFVSGTRIPSTEPRYNWLGVQTLAGAWIGQFEWQSVGELSLPAWKPA
jgi:hypothetical protein